MMDVLHHIVGGIFEDIQLFRGGYHTVKWRDDIMSLEG